MPLTKLTREDKKLFDILKEHDENNLLIKVGEGEFAILNDQQKEAYAADVIHLLTERSNLGRMAGYKKLEDRKAEIEEANKAAIAERAKPDPSFNAPGMDELYKALQKEQTNKNSTILPKSDEFKRMKLNEKIKLVENFIEGCTDSVGGHISDAVAGATGLFGQYGNKQDREKALYDAAAALDPMLEAYQDRNPDAPVIFQYKNRDVMDKLYGETYKDIETHLEDSRGLPSRAEFYQMSAEDRNNKLTELMEQDNLNSLSDGIYFSEKKAKELKSNLKDLDEEAALFNLDDWDKMDKLYGKAYADLKHQSKDLPSRGEFYSMEPQDRINLVSDLIPEKDGRLDGFSYSVNPRKDIIKKLKAADKKAAEHNDSYEMSTAAYIDPNKNSDGKSTTGSIEVDEDGVAPYQMPQGYVDADEMGDSYDANPEETKLVAAEKQRNFAPYAPADVYIDPEEGERIPLKPEPTKEGVLFKFPEVPHDTLVIETGTDKTGFRFEPQQEAKDKGENITIETPSIDARGKEIPGQFEKLIFNPQTNEILLHHLEIRTVDPTTNETSIDVQLDNFPSRLDQSWLKGMSQPKSRSRITMGAPQAPEFQELSEENLSQHSKSDKGSDKGLGSLSISELSKKTDATELDPAELRSQQSGITPDLMQSSGIASRNPENMRRFLGGGINFATSSVASSDEGSEHSVEPKKNTKKSTSPNPLSVVASMRAAPAKKPSTTKTKPAPEGISAYLETEDGTFSLGKNSAGNFVLGDKVIIEVKPGGKKFEVKENGKFVVDVATTGGKINRFTYDNKKITGPTAIENPTREALQSTKAALKRTIVVEEATEIDAPSSGSNVKVRNNGSARNLL